MPCVVVPSVYVFTGKNAEIVERPESGNALNLKYVFVFFADVISRHLPHSVLYLV